MVRHKPHLDVVLGIGDQRIPDDLSASKLSVKNLQYMMVNKVVASSSTRPVFFFWAWRKSCKKIAVQAFRRDESSYKSIMRIKGRCKAWTTQALGMIRAAFRHFVFWLFSAVER